MENNFHPPERGKKWVFVNGLNGFKSGSKLGFGGAQVGEWVKAHFLPTFEPIWTLTKTHFKPLSGGGKCFPKRALRPALTQHKIWGIWVPGPKKDVLVSW